ncbi:tyrosine--tRNA ligase [Candidatus Berkelbacteria bacterium]|nr:tyrosine--tRNA ligase [Candidatus Berkelbacteria bacterium]
MAQSPYWKLAAEEIYPNERAFTRRLGEGSCHVYLGIDITGPVVHLGHAVVLRILKSLQEEGHRVTLLLGSFTTLIGDPSGRDSSRPVLSEAEIAQNVRTYKEQVFRILDPKRTSFRDNSEWFTDPRAMGSLRNFLTLGHHFTAAQLWERDMFQTRQAKGQPVTLTEFIYPVLQGYDFVALDADVQVGGTDQTFNMLAGRELGKKMGTSEKFVITTRLLTGTDGRKMSKSYHNFVGVLDEPNDMYGKLMSIRDEQLPEYFELAAGIDASSRASQALIAEDPRGAKAKMAYEVVTFYHGTTRAEQAQAAFTAQFREGHVPTDLPERTPSVSQAAKVAFFLVDLGLASSKSEAMRLIEQGGVTVDEARIEDPQAVMTPHHGMIIKVGKRRYAKVKLV